MALTDKLTNIADAIREKTGSTRTMNLEGMANAINAIQTGGGGTTDHSKLENRDAADQHPISAITGLEEALTPLVGTTQTITPSQVLAAIKAGRDIALQYTDSNFVFSAFNANEQQGIVVSNSFLPEQDGLMGTLMGIVKLRAWNFSTTNTATKDDVGTAVNEALAQAKASGEFDGADGLTPTIGENGNWYLGETDTGKPSRGDKGDKGDTGATGSDGLPGVDGADGVGIQSVVQTTTSTEDGGMNVVTVTKTDGTSSTFSVKNGSKGSKGDTGAQGEQGIQGIQGEKGDKGDTGATGAAGAAGKSAYEYAQDGGYTGTETEFAAKLAKEKLPNPYALTFTGAVDKVYDGSQEITIEIPSGGSEDDWNIIADETLTEDVIEVVYNGLSLRKILICIYAIGSAANTTNGNSTISINGNNIFYSPNITVVGDTTTRWAQFFADCIKDTIRFYASTNNNNTYQSTQIMTGWFDGVSKIETVKIHSDGLTRMIGAGTRIRILGVTAS